MNRTKVVILLLAFSVVFFSCEQKQQPSHFFLSNNWETLRSGGKGTRPMLSIRHVHRSDSIIQYWIKSSGYDDARVTDTTYVAVATIKGWSELSLDAISENSSDTQLKLACINDSIAVLFPILGTEFTTLVRTR